MPNSATSTSPLERAYSDFEKGVNSYDCSGTAVSRLTRFNGNKNLPGHRWFPFKEGFSAELYDWIIAANGLGNKDRIKVLDPFCGVGTSLLSAQLKNEPPPVELVGFEINPFIASVARTKLNWPLLDPDTIAGHLACLAHQLRAMNSQELDVPKLSTLHNPRYFDYDILQDLLQSRSIIQETVPDCYRDFFVLGWASIIEIASNLRKDGRALRYVEKGQRPPVAALLTQKWDEMLGDVRVLRRDHPQSVQRSVEVTIHNEDGRTLSSLNSQLQEFDLVLYSPPYPNNIDYTEVYKLELWLSGFVDTAEQFRDLRRNTFRSHPSVKFSEASDSSRLDQTSETSRLLTHLLDAIPTDDNASWRKRIFRQYTEDIVSSIWQQSKFMSDTGKIVCVVGNSVHGNRGSRFCVAADLLVAAAARDLGLAVDSLYFARKLTRRTHPSDYNRESIVVISKQQ